MCFKKGGDHLSVSRLSPGSSRPHEAPEGECGGPAAPSAGRQSVTPTGGSAFPETRGVPRGCLGLAPAPRERHHLVGKSDCHREPQMRRSQQRDPAAGAEPGRVQQAHGDSAGPRRGRR